MFYPEGRGATAKLQVGLKLSHLWFNKMEIIASSLVTQKKCEWLRVT